VSENKGESDQLEAAKNNVDRVIRDFDAGNVTRRDAERVQDRSGRALRDMDAYRGIRSSLVGVIRGIE
jgi:hypothetical protein